MTDLLQNQAAWNQLYREAGLPLGRMFELADMGRKVNPVRARIQVREFDNVNGFTSAWVLTGVVIGTNTDELGTLFVRITNANPSSGHALVSLYLAAGGSSGNLVAQGSGAYGTTVALTAQNGSGLSGTVAIGTVTASETNDQHTLIVYH